jgi:hypothetical protein
LNSLKNLANKVEYLFFDQNSLIHPCSHQILATNEDKYLCILDDIERTNVIEFDIIQNCINYTRLIINIINPKQVFIMIDGVAPRSKMNQQRERRYKSHFFKELEIGKSFLWDSNKITPGTEFMEKLTKELHLQFPNFTISDSNEPGEGEHKMMQILSNTNEINGNILIYGLDCVTEDTPLLLLNENNQIEIKTVGNLNNIWEIKDNGKEYGKTNYKIWSELGWTKIENIMRRKVDKDIYRVLTNTGCIDVTEDHKLLKNDKNIITPKECKINDSLLHSFPYFEENKLDISNTHNLQLSDLRILASKLKIKQYQKFKKSDLIKKINNIYENEIFMNINENKTNNINKDEAYIMGLWWADGTCGVYKYKNKKNKVKDGYMYNYQWYISNCDLTLLNNAKILIEKLYNVDSTIFEDKHQITKINRQKSYKLKINGGKLIQNIIDKYINMFYYKNQHIKYKNGNKYIPVEILNASRNVRESFLLGYYNGDGTGHSLNVIRKSMDVESKISCQSIYYLCRSLGYEVSINIRNDKPSVYKLLITKGYQTKDKNKIKKIINLGKTDKYVYDLQTSNHHFQAGIGQMIVHNCDLIMLSMINKFNDKIVLIRDTEFGEIDNISYVNIKQLKDYIFQDFKYKFKYETKQDFFGTIDQFINDYILLTFLLGNDFLDHIFCLYIKNNSIDIVTKAYIKAYNGTPLVNKKEKLEEWINFKFLKDIFYQLKNYEEYYLKQNKNTYPIKGITIEQIEKYNNNNSDSNLYFYHNNLNTNDKNFKTQYNNFYNIQNTSDVCFNYIEGLQWVLGYYNGHIHNNWSWYYKFHNVPFCSDIFNYLNKNKNSICIKINSDVPFNSFNQLCLVLPKYSFKNLITNNLILNNKEIFPSKLYVDIHYKEFLWQSKIIFHDINENIIDLYN